MTLSIHSIASHELLGGLTTLRALVDKAVAHADSAGTDVAALLEARLAPDMFTFVQQIRAATDTARRGLDRLAGVEASSVADDEKTADDLRARIDATIAHVKNADAAAIDASTDRAFDVPLGEITLPFTGRRYLLGYVLPNFLFHVTTAYDILRNHGVPLAKRDFLAPFIMTGV